MDLIKDKDFLDFAAKQESQFINPASDFSDLAISSFEDGDSMAGLKLPWPKTHERFALRPA